MVYFSASILGFIPEQWKKDGTYTEKTWPADAVLLSESAAKEFWKVSAPDGKKLGYLNGRPCWVPLPSEKTPTRSDIESSRLRAYADPLAGSDRLFSESTRMQIMGENGHEEVSTRAIARFEEIQAQYPWPAK